MTKGMIKTKAKVSERLLKAVEETPPESPMLSSADKTFLRGLKRRGYSEQEIAVIVQKAGMVMPPDLFKTRTRKPAEK